MRARITRHRSQPLARVSRGGAIFLSKEGDDNLGGGELGRHRALCESTHGDDFLQRLGRVVSFVHRDEDVGPEHVENHQADNKQRVLIAELLRELHECALVLVRCHLRTRCE